MAESDHQPIRPVRQVGQEVTMFSSQYGMGRNYSASNLAGAGYSYPAYGDFVQAFVLRTYGRWWKIAPSCPCKLKCKTRTPTDFISQDFADIAYEVPVYPKVINILETYNPGAVVRILALQTDTNMVHTKRRWVTLWSGPPQCPPPVARMFSPQIRRCDKPTSLIRLEFNQDHLDYYTELDAVELMGNLPVANYVPSPQPANTMSPATSAVVSTTKLFKQLSISDKSQHDDPNRHPAGDNGFFDILPSEVCHFIFTYLELTDLIKAACTCKLFFLHCYDPVWFKELDLQPYWTLLQISDTALAGIQSRCTGTEKLSLAWAGPYGAVTAAGFENFLLSSCGQLICLRLSSCSFVTSHAVYTISRTCPSLQELDISSCKAIGEKGFLELQMLKKLERLNLYQTAITDTILVSALCSWPTLKHLNLGGCADITQCDDITQTLALHCSLLSLDLWRQKSLTSDGVFNLANGCTQLQELEIGWCTNVVSSSGCIQELTRKCPKLKKLFMAAIRSVSDDDVNEIAENCKELEQLDILGTALVTMVTIKRVVQNCCKLKFADLSFCNKLSNEFVKQLRQDHPNIAFKKSFVSSDGQ
ncbi:F-box/LRR-repeat protein 4 isoform X2 [Nematostella vectensis]|uniref:F-box/LRR-repeat protein 4 isoform X2 n=1 Tax=Nematostella vectensis TaxID=45351 RepID=UPI002077530A|nr:F-box/LRR-repeat protein 4 isoform X2 [Nematostella vectensis]